MDRAPESSACRALAGRWLKPARAAAWAPVLVLFDTSSSGVGKCFSAPQKGRRVSMPKGVGWQTFAALGVLRRVRRSRGGEATSSDVPVVAVLHHRDDIQGLRAVAVLLVVLDHAGVSFLRGGYVGVDVFFVLSGFLITGHPARRRRQAWARLASSTSTPPRPTDLAGRGADARCRRSSPTTSSTTFARRRLSGIASGQSLFAANIRFRASRRRITSRRGSRRRPCSITGRSQSRSSSTSCGRRFSR